jgi:hypothetical protein
MQLKIKHLKEKFITIFTINNLNALFLVDGFVELHQPQYPTQDSHQIDRMEPSEARRVNSMF